MEEQMSPHSQIIDPDYQTNNYAFGSKRNDNENVIKNIKKIITNEFDKELSDRQMQIEQIQYQIAKAQKLLHLVRYAVITSYYNRPELECSQTEEEFKDLNVLGGQKRLHPALKKILGSNASLDFLNNRSKRKAAIKLESPSTEIVSSSSTEIQSKRMKFDTSSSDELKNENHPVVKENIPIALKENLQPHIHHQEVRTRKKVKHTIIVGNISLWMPPSLEDSLFSNCDNLTHKWMVYVRGPKESPEVSHFIDKVIFHLHPSFKPHDVLEISKPPFHLKKIGWGEFPLKIIIHFKNVLNKPVEIWHALKLPKEHPGKQVLGNETIVEVYLHEEPNNVEIPKAQKMIKIEPEFEIDDIEIVDHNLYNSIKENIKLEVFEEAASTSFEHDYCYADIDMDNVEHEGIRCNDPVRDELNVSFDHPYSLPPTSEYLNIDKPTTKESSYDLNPETLRDLVHGLGDNYLTDDGVKKITSDDKSSFVFPNVNTKFIMEPNLMKIDKMPIVLPYVKSSRSLLKKNQCLTLNKKVKITNNNFLHETYETHCDGLDIKRIDNENFLVHLQEATNNTGSLSSVQNSYRLIIPKDRYKNVGEVLPFLFKHLPLYIDRNDKLKNKCLYIFTAKTFEEFRSWNIGKRLNSEWLRAKTILRILKTSKIVGYEKWNTRAVIMYGRSHSYTPYTTYDIFNIFNKQLPEKNLLCTCFSLSDSSRKTFVIDRHKVELNIAVNVVDDTKESPNRHSAPVIDIIDPRMKHQCTFVRQSALDCGIVLKPEEIEPGVIFNGAERIILEAMKCLSENLVRRAMNYRICNGINRGESIVIEKQHLQMAIKERREIQSIFEFGKMRRNMKFYS